VIPHAFGERPVLKLLYAAVIRAADRWRGLTSFSGAPKRDVSGRTCFPTSPRRGRWHRGGSGDIR